MYRQIIYQYRYLLLHIRCISHCIYMTSGKIEQLKLDFWNRFKHASLTEIVPNQVFQRWTNTTRYWYCSRIGHIYVTKLIPPPVLVYWDKGNTQITWPSLAVSVTWLKGNLCRKKKFEKNYLTAGLEKAEPIKWYE